VLYSVVDFAAWRGGAPTPINAQSRLLLVGARQGVNSALLVRRALGLRPQIEMHATGDVRTGLGETAPWLGRTLQGRPGHHLDPVADPRAAVRPTLSRHCALSAAERKDHGLKPSLQATSFDRRKSRGPAATGGPAPAVDRRGAGTLPVIGHLGIETQFRILGSVFLISLLISIAAIFMQVQGTARGTTFLSVASHIAPLTQQIPKAALAAMEGQKDGFAELREARDAFAKLLESLVEGGEVKGIKVAATSPEARPALDALRESWIKQNEAINLVLANENRLVAINRLAIEAATRGGRHDRGRGSRRRQVATADRAHPACRPPTGLGSGLR
jgi:hypothetical protein